MRVYATTMTTTMSSRMVMSASRRNLTRPPMLALGYATVEHAITLPRGVDCESEGVMRVQPIVVTLAIGALVLPVCRARAASGAQAGHASAGHAASGTATGGRGTTGHATSGRAATPRAHSTR